LLGHEIAEKLEITETNLGESLWIDGQRFRIEGILEEKGAFFGMSQDDLVLIPYTSGLKLYPSLENKLAVNVSATHEDSVAEAKSQIISVLRRQHRLGPEQPNDFQIRTQGEILKIFENVSLAALVVLTGIVGISLLVGGIGIMNVMLVSVTERTREIGLRKAVGARRRDILGQFLTEAMALSLLGGLLGILIAYGLTTLASLHPKMIAIKVPFWSLGVGFGISAFTGIFFGMLPALKAALLNPIDALRHE
jgi:putative ABC transport system permease protein